MSVPIAVQGAESGTAPRQNDERRKFFYRLVTVMIGGMFLDGYILGIIGPVTGGMAKSLDLSTIWQGLIASGPLFGILVGSPIFGWATDKFGRKNMFLLDMGIFVAASLLQFVAGSVPVISAAAQLFVIRFVMGIAIGGEYSIGWPFLSEFSPTRVRGRLLSLTQLGWYAGFMIAFIIGYLLVAFTHVDWRIILGTSTIFAVALLVGRIGLPESPHWLWSKGRHDEAMKIAEHFLEDPKAFGEAVEEELETPKGSFRQLFNAQNWRATLFVAGFWFCAVTPYFAIATFAGPVLSQYGLADGLVGGVAVNVLSFFGCLVCVLLIEKVGRRALCVPLQWVCTVLLGVIGIWSGAPSIVSLLLFLGFAFFNAIYATLPTVYPSEVFATEVRGIGTGFSTAVSRVGAGLGTFALPWAIANLGMSASMIIAAVIALVGAILSQWLAPETKGLSLAKTDTIYLQDTVRQTKLASA